MTEPMPDPGSQLEDEGVPSQQEGHPDKILTGDAQEGMAAPAEEPTYTDAHGTTPQEVSEGPSLEEQVDAEEPEPTSPTGASTEPYPEDPEEHSGRLVEPDEGAHTDVEKDTVARDAGPDMGGFEPEERAIHVEEER